MNFESFIEERKLIVGVPDRQKAKALVKMSVNSLKSANLLEISKITASSILVMAYESLREILEAICLLKGYKVYSHEFYTFYLKSLDEFILAEKFDRLRKLRNCVNYYGKPVSEMVAKNAKQQVHEIILSLKKKYLSELK
jgi:hypothetical protein